MLSVLPDRAAHDTREGAQQHGVCLVGYIQCSTRHRSIGITINGFIVRCLQGDDDKPSRSRIPGTYPRLLLILWHIHKSQPVHVGSRLKAHAECACTSILHLRI